MADSLFARISSQAAAAQAQAATMSFSTVTNTAGVLPTPSSCASKTVSFSSGANTAGCTFGPQGDDISPYKDCCKSAPLLSYSDGCGFYCKAQGQSLDALQKCLSNISNTRSISCSSNSNSGGGSGSSVNEFSSGGDGGSSSSSSSGPSDGNNNDFDSDFFNDDDDITNDNGDDSQGGGSAVGASTEAVAGPGQTAIAKTSDGPNGASGFGTTINGVPVPSGFPFPSGFAAPSGGIVNNNGPQGNQGGSDVVASTAAVAGPGQTAIASTSAGPNGADGFGTTIGGAAAPSGFVANPSAGAPFPQGNSTNFIASNTPAGSPTGSPTGTAPFQSFTGAASSVKAPGAGISKGGLLTVGLLVFGAFTGAML